MSEYYTSELGRIEEILGECGVYASVVRGSSMRPLLRQGMDVVYIFPITERVKKYDVLLYRRDGRYILHRVIGFYDGGYIIRGDNTYKKEYVDASCGVGVLAKFNKHGKEYSANSKLFVLYGILVQVFYLPRFCLVMTKRKLEKIIKKLKK